MPTSADIRGRMVASMQSAGILVGEDKHRIAAELERVGVLPRDVENVITWAWAASGVESPARFVSKRLKQPETFPALAEDARFALEAWFEEQQARATKAEELASRWSAPSHANAGLPPAGPCVHGIDGARQCGECEGAARRRMREAYAAPRFAPTARVAPRSPAKPGSILGPYSPLTDEDVEGALRGGGR